jgi:hypothetical protein
MTAICLKNTPKHRCPLPIFRGIADAFRVDREHKPLSVHNPKALQVPFFHDFEARP